MLNLCKISPVLVLCKPSPVFRQSRPSKYRMPGSYLLGQRDSVFYLSRQVCRHRCAAKLDGVTNFFQYVCAPMTVAFSPS